MTETCFDIKQYEYKSTIYLTFDDENGTYKLSFHDDSGNTILKQRGVQDYIIDFNDTDII